MDSNKMQMFIIMAAILVFNSFHVSEGQGCAISSGVSPEDIDIIVNEHNILRSTVATGAANPPQPSASNMKLMKWNVELAGLAQKLADQCSFEHNNGNLKTDQFPYIGQNLGEVPGTGDLDVNAAFKTAIDNWYAEISNFTALSGSIAPFVYNDAYGHYSQVVWAETTDVGCGYSYFLDTDNTYTKLHVCNYGPAGNFEQGASMYTEGSACGNCTNACSQEYNGLCE